MKIIEKEIGGNGKPRLTFAVNKQELELLYGVVRKAYLHTPKVIDTIRIMGRLKDMSKELAKGVKRFNCSTADSNKLFNSNKMSDLPCAICKGNLIEFTIPNDIWNKVIRKSGAETDREYLCINCFFDELRKELSLKQHENSWQGNQKL